MKKYFSFALSLLAVMTAFTACTLDEGTTPGGDSKPVVTLYSFEPSIPNNPDNDIRILLAANNQTSEVFYLAEKTADKDARNMSEAAYADYVAANGSKVELTTDSLTGGKAGELLVTGLFGPYTITAVAVNGGAKSLASTTFTGLEWETVTGGTYYFSNPNTQFLLGGVESRHTELQICTTDATLYRFKDVFSDGVHMKIRLLPSYKGEDDGGVYTFFRVPDQRIGVQYQGVDAYVRDIGYWQGDDAWITDNGYESGMYEDYSCFIMVQLHVGSSNYGYNYYDAFIPD